MKKQNFAWKNLNLGTCYYPEHWDKSLWESDLTRMLDAGIGTIRIAEFAWSKVEPTEGNFVFDFWDEFLELCNKKGMKVIFCTPTATPPAWLTEKYPEVLNCTIDGVPYRHGMRCNYTYNSEKYRELTAIIVEKIAEHYAKNPAIIGWQLGNEQNCETNRFYSEADSLAFREFLKKKYGNLEELNRAWGNMFWNQEYTDWKEIFVPRRTVPGNTNPHLLLDYDRFISDSAISYMKLQTDILRKYIKPGDFVTTNGLFGSLDNHRLEKEALDVYTYDSYPNFAYTLDADPLNDKNLRDRYWGLILSETRSICPHFGIMEQESGALGWNYRMESPAPKPGQLQLWAMQSIAHGADYVSFFRWRTCSYGTEMYWHGILDYDNRDNRKLEEVRKLSKKLDRIQEICGSDFIAEFALVRDYDNNFDAEIDKWHGRLQRPSENAIFVASQKTHSPMDILYMLEDTTIEDLVKYKALIYPHPLIISEHTAGLLENYVMQGGVLIMGARAGMKDTDAHALMMPMPGMLSGICGAEVREWTFVSQTDGKVMMSWDGKLVDTGIFNDILEIKENDAISKTAEVVGQYLNNYYKTAPALVETQTGKGKVLQFGGTFTNENAAFFLKYAGVQDNYRRIMNIPEEVELCVREKDGHRYFILLNYTASEQYVGLFKNLTVVDTGRVVEELLTLKAYEVAVLRED